MGLVGAHVESANETMVRRTALIGLTHSGDEIGIARIELLGQGDEAIELV